MKNPESDVLKFTMVFDESVRGLAVGAPVDFRGIPIGEVTAIKLEIDPATRRILTPIDVNVYPQRLRQLRRDYAETRPLTREERKEQNRSTQWWRMGCAHNCAQAVCLPGSYTLH
jgi:paraquat-inducible protein B